MKQAVTSDGKMVEAKATAPREAFCPYCGARTVLRRRRRMGKSPTTYYWRHQDNRNLHCPARVGPVR